MAARDVTLLDQAAHKIAVLALRGEIHGRRRAAVVAEQEAGIERLTEMAVATANKDKRKIGARNGRGSQVRDVADQADAANLWSRRNITALSLVVEGDIS